MTSMHDRMTVTVPEGELDGLKVERFERYTTMWVGFGIIGGLLGRIF